MNLFCSGPEPLLVIYDVSTHYNLVLTRADRRRFQSGIKKNLRPAAAPPFVEACMRRARRTTYGRMAVM